MRWLLLFLASVLSVPAVAFGQLPSSQCDSQRSLADCSALTPAQPPTGDTLILNLLDNSGSNPNAPRAGDVTSPTPDVPERERFHWRRALTESATFLVIEQAYVVHSDFGWVVSENGVPFNHYWRDYTQSLSKWTQSGWNDGDPNWYGYVGHPIQGALTGFIQIQNDPASQGLVFSRTKAYWWSRFKAFLWNAAYSTQWNLGPVSEVTVEKYGTKDRAPWNYNGTYPCTHHCLTGVGQIDIVMTPLGGTGWLIGEDFLDEKVIRRVEGATQNRLVIDTVRSALNPIRGGANILHGKYPWYRASRDGERMGLFSQQKPATHETIRPKQFPNSGDVFVGYSHIGSTHCQAAISDMKLPCDAYSTKIASLGGWDASVEKKYLRYFGGVADFSGQYGNVSTTDFLFGLRGGASVAGFRPFAEVLFGAARVHENGFKSNTSFAEALGLGADVRIMRMLGWRIQADELRTELTPIQQRNLRISTGLLVHF